MNKKWIYAVCLAASLTLLLTACGGPTTDIASSDANGAGPAASESLSQESAVTTESSSAVDAAVEENAFSDADTKASSSANTETAATVTQRREEAGAPSSPSPTVEEKTTAATSHTTAAPSTTRQPAVTKPSSSSRPTLPTLPTTSRPTSSKPTTTTTNTTTPPASDSLDRAEQVTALVNAERAKAGLPALTLNRELSANATVRAREIINSFSHTRPNGNSFSSAITLSYRTAGENIAYGYSSAESVMNGWMNSAGHKANILKSSYTQIGVGVVENRGTLYWVQLFIG